MRRLFWLGVGVAAGFSLSRKMTRTARRASPVGLAENLGEAMRELATAVGSFGADVRAGMSEREDELREVIADRGGVVIESTLAPRERYAVAPARRHSAARTRARRAEG